MSYTRSMGATAIEYPMSPPPPPPPPPRLVRATAAMARASRRPFGDITTDQAIAIVNSESGKPPAVQPAIPSWVSWAGLGLAAYYLTRGGR